jgi:hypothetical protein
MAEDRYGRVVHAGDTVSVFVPVEDHNGVGDVREVTGRFVTVVDAGGQVVTVAASDVNVDWSDYPQVS